MKCKKCGITLFPRDEDKKLCKDCVKEASLYTEDEAIEKIKMKIDKIEISFCPECLYYKTPNIFSQNCPTCTKYISPYHRQRRQLITREIEVGELFRKELELKNLKKDLRENLTLHLQQGETEPCEIIYYGKKYIREKLNEKRAGKIFDYQRKRYKCIKFAESPSVIMEELNNENNTMHFCIDRSIAKEFSEINDIRKEWIEILEHRSEYHQTETLDYKDCEELAKLLKEL